MSEPRDKGETVTVERTLVRRVLGDLEMLVGAVEISLPDDDQKAKMPVEMRQVLDHVAARCRRTEEHIQQLREQTGVDPDEDLDD